MRKYRYKPKHKKHYRIRKRKSIFRRWSFWLLLFFFIIFGAAFYFFIFSPTFQIKEIKVTGEIKIPVEELKNTISNEINSKIAFFNLRNIFLTNLEGIDKTILEKFPQIAKVKIIKEFPNVLAAQVEERKPVAIFCQDEDCFFIDKEGVIFKEVAGPETKMLKIKSNSQVALELGDEIVDKEKMEKILEINSKSTIPLEEILIVSERRFNAKTSEGWEIYFNPRRDLAWQLEELSILLKQRIPPEKRGKLQYIDLRFEKIYIYPESYQSI